MKDTLTVFHFQMLHVMLMASSLEESVSLFFCKGMCDNIVFYFFFECLVGLIVIDMNRDKLTPLITYLMQIERLVDGLPHKPNN